MQRLDALRTPDVDSALLELDLGVDLEAILAENVMTVLQSGEVLQRRSVQTKRTFPNLEIRHPQ